MTPELADESGWDIYEIARSDDPHAHWAALREVAPVFDAGDGVFPLTKWEQVHQVLHDARFGAGQGVAASFGNGSGLVFDAMRAWLMSLDGPPHQRARGLVRRQFTPRQLGSLRPLITELCDTLVSAVEAGGESVDLMRALAFPLPSQVIRSLFGFEADVWAREIEALFAPGAAGEADALATLDSMAQFFQRTLEGVVPEGLLAKLQVADEELGALSELEVVANAVLLVSAAIDTTAGLIGSALQCLLERPALLARVREDPQLIPAAVEETLRFEPPALSCSRTAHETFVLEGVEIPAGSQLLLSLAAANRDPDRYADPDVFKLDRDHTGLLSFGGGRHFCLGAALARVEAVSALTRLFVQSELELELLSPPTWDLRNPTVRALAHLPVRVSKRK